MTQTLVTAPANRWPLVLVLLAWSLLHAWVLHLYGIPWQQAALDSLLSNGLLALTILLTTNAMQYYLPSGSQVMYAVALTVFGTLVWFGISRWMLLLLPNVFPDYEDFWSRGVPIRIGIAGMVLFSANLLNLLWMSLQRHEAESKKIARIDALARDTELMKLRQQLQPHFLFNSLNSISALIGIDAKAARGMIHQLADFFRNTIAAEQKPMQPLENEWQHLQLYLAIEKVRFGDRLDVVAELEPNAMDKMIPSLLLQPVLENAIKYGLYEHTGPVKIVFKAAVTPEGLRIDISNPYHHGTTAPAGTGFGLSSVQQRLFLMYGRAGLLETRREAERFFTTLIIPQTA